MKTYQLLAFFFASSFLVIACKKDDPVVNDPTPTTTTQSYASLNDYMEQSALASEFVSFDAALGLSFSAAKGSHLTVPPNAFVHADGSAVVGTIQMEIKEVFSNHDMIHADKFPYSFSSVLNSGGEFYLRARQGSEELGLADGIMVNLEIPAQAVDEMELFFDIDDEAIDSADWGWGLAEEFFQSNSSFTFSSADQTYSIDLDTCHWGNIDAFMNVQYFDINFNLTGLNGLNSYNTTAFAIFVDENTVWPMGVSPWGTIINNVIHETHLADVHMNIV
ncbi:MAG: hypothetical protein KDC12_14640 [Flavobacteriales bacterium]|nr:hypothetical protein [Flavobacteriales bacterium]